MSQKLYYDALIAVSYYTILISMNSFLLQMEIEEYRKRKPYIFIGVLYNFQILKTSYMTYSW